MATAAGSSCGRGAFGLLWILTFVATVSTEQLIDNYHQQSPHQSLQTSSEVVVDSAISGPVGSAATSTPPPPGVGIYFTLDPTDVVVSRTADAIFTCAVSDRSATVSWRKDGKLIGSVGVASPRRGGNAPAGGSSTGSGGGSTRRHVTVGPSGPGSSQLRIEKPQTRADFGQYECVASNGNGVLVSRAATLNIEELGRFTTQPLNQSLVEGQTARFQCIIDGIPKPAISWEKDHQPIQQHTERSVELPSIGVLLIENVTIADAGNYRCRASGSVRTRERYSVDGKLHVSPAASATSSFEAELLVGPEDADVVVGESVVFECAAVTYTAINSGTYSLTWQRLDGKPLPVDRSRILGRGSLEIRNVTVDEEGIYRCFFVDFPTVSVEAMLSVIVPPRSVQSLRNLARPRSSQLRMTCNVTGRPTPKVTWLKNGEPLTPAQLYDSSGDERLHVRGNSLSIMSVEDADAGIYQCWAENPAGQIGMAMRLSIQAGSSDIPNPPTGLRVVVLSSRVVELFWNRPVPKFGHQIVAYAIHYKPAGGDSAELQKVVEDTRVRIETLQPFTLYRFYVIAYSNRAASNASVPVEQRTDEDIPVAVPQVQLSVDGPTSVHVQWERLSSELARGNITRYQIVYKRYEGVSERKIEVAGHVNEYTLTDLVSNVKYEILVIAGTKAGYPSVDDNWEWNSIMLGEPGDPYIGKIENARVIVHSPTQIEVLWDEVKQSSIRGAEFIGYRIAYRSQDDPTMRTINVLPEYTNHVIPDLAPNTTYEVSLCILTDVNEGMPTTWSIRTLPADLNENTDPRSFPLLPPPNNVRAEPLNETAILVSWSLPSSTGNGHITSYYNISCIPAMAVSSDDPTTGEPSTDGSANSSSAIFVLSHDVSAVIAGLEPNTEYLVSVCSANLGLICGTFSDVTLIRTAEGRPSKPRDVTVRLVNALDVHVTWNPPLRPNGVITSYVVVFCETYAEPDSTAPLTMTTSSQVLCSQKFVTGTSNSTLLRSLHPGTVYHVSVQAVTARGTGPASKTEHIETQWDNGVMRDLHSGSTNNDRLMGIVIGVAISGCCIIICIFIILLRNRCVNVSRRASWTHYGCCAPVGHDHHHHHHPQLYVNGCACHHQHLNNGAKYRDMAAIPAGSSYEDDMSSTPVLLHQNGHLPSSSSPPHANGYHHRQNGHCHQLTNKLAQEKDQCKEICQDAPTKPLINGVAVLTGRPDGPCNCVSQTASVPDLHVSGFRSSVVHKSNGSVANSSAVSSDHPEAVMSDSAGGGFNNVGKRCSDPKTLSPVVKNT